MVAAAEHSVQILPAEPGVEGAPQGIDPIEWLRGLTEGEKIGPEKATQKTPYMRRNNGFEYTIPNEGVVLNFNDREVLVIPGGAGLQVYYKVVDVPEGRAHDTLRRTVLAAIFVNSGLITQVNIRMDGRVIPRKATPTV